MKITKYKAQEEYQKRIGLKAKSYKLDEDLVNNFKIACEKADISQAKQLSIMMQQFIDSVNNKEGGAT